MGEQGQERLEKDGEFELLDLEPEVKEFVRAGAGRPRKAVKKRNSANSYLGMAVLLAAVLVVALCAVLWLKQPVIVVVLVIVLEEALAVCLRRAPLWLHGIVVVLNVVLGAVFGRLLFLLLANLVYLAEILSAHYQRRGRQ